VPVGYDFSSKITYTDSSNTAIDLTGVTLSMSIQAKNSAVDLLTLAIVGDDSTTGIYVPDPTSGEFYIQIREAETDTLGVGDFVYFIDYTDTNSNKTRFLYGGISLTEV
jgi:hypothetical protein